uniref:Uncharacterized protein n=1 Tax=Oncorhynchus tshawytscha TaxID=74940 RepID=A0A8C8J7K6_ONCTS
KMLFYQILCTQLFIVSEMCVGVIVAVGPPLKQGAALLLGLSITIATCQVHALHSLVTVLGTWIIIKSSWR